jgi:hypothetical protein
MSQFTEKARVDGLLECSRCHQWLPETGFFKRYEPKSKLGRQSWCKQCQRVILKASYDRMTPEEKAAYAAKRRERIIQRKYGLNGDEYDRMLAEQNGGCAICGEAPSDERNLGRQLVVDHDHATGKVRGLLCSPCNRGLGHFNDDAERVAAALRYLS